MNAPEKFELKISRFIRAPREKVYDAFVKPELMSRWMGMRGATIPEANSDAREGGKWDVVMVAPDGTRMKVGGAYRELRRPERLVYTWQWLEGMPAGPETLIEVDFRTKDGGTELSMRHSGFPMPILRDHHGVGWESSFNRLTDLLDEAGSAATLTLVGIPESSYVWTTRMGLAEKGVKYRFQSAPPHSAEVTAIHPFGKVPAFRDGAFEIFETSAILRYVDAAFGGPALVPGGLRDRTKCEQWVSSVNAYFYDSMVRRYVIQYIFPKGEGGKPDRGVIDGALKEIRPQLAALDKAYGGGDFITGANLTMADLFVAPIVCYLGQMPEGKELLAAAPNVARAAKIMQQRPSFAATAPQKK